MRLPKLTGGMAAPKPWQIGAGVALLFLFILLVPAMSSLLSARKKQNAAATAQVGQQGEPYHPAAFPAPPKALAVQQPPAAPPPPPPAPTASAPPPPAAAAPAAAPLAAGRPGKAPPDPEQDAIDSPILISSGPGGAPPPQQAAPHGRATGEAEGAVGGSPSALGGLLKPTELPGYRATVMSHPEATIEQGRRLACHNVTPITSGLPGFVSAQLTYDAWSADDTTKLLDKDSTAFGEIAHGLGNGQDRLFVLWRQVTTPKPNLVRITLNSPGADEMGEAGLPGDINHHYREKIGGALLLSGVDAILSGASSGLSNALSNRNNGSSQSQGQGLNVYQFQGQGTNLASQLLASTITIPDTLHRDQALPCTIYVSGDLRFDDVYVATRRNAR